MLFFITLQKRSPSLRASSPDSAPVGRNGNSGRSLRVRSRLTSFGRRPVPGPRGLQPMPSPLGKPSQPFSQFPSPQVSHPVRPVRSGVDLPTTRFGAMRSGPVSGPVVCPDRIRSGADSQVCTGFHCYWNHDRKTDWNYLLIGVPPTCN